MDHVRFHSGEWYKMSVSSAEFRGRRPEPYYFKRCAIESSPPRRALHRREHPDDSARKPSAERYSGATKFEHGIFAFSRN